MKKNRNDAVSAPATLDLGLWLGRREAFGAVAGRCSAAEIECIRRIRNGKLFRSHSRNWDEFCTTHLRASRRSVDTNIRLFDEFGPAYFHLAQLLHITPAEYRGIAPQIGADGLSANGETIPLLPENRDRIAAVIGEVRAKREKAATQSETDRFELALAHCEAAAALLEKHGIMPKFDRQLVMAGALNRLRHAATRLGVFGPTVPRALG